MKILFLFLSITFCTLSNSVASSSINPDFTSKLTNLQQNLEKATPKEPGEKALNSAKIAVTIGVLAAAVLLVAAIGMQGYFVGAIVTGLIMLIGTIVGAIKAKRAMRKSEKGTKIWKKGLLLKKVALLTLIAGVFLAATISGETD
jgi:ATP/ADP translocase